MIIYTNNPKKALELITPNFAKNLQKHLIDAGRMKPEEAMPEEEIDREMAKRNQSSQKAEELASLRVPVD